MSFDVNTLYHLLPAYYRARDAAPVPGVEQGPLQALLALIAESVAALEEDLDQLYDDQFIETCAEWVVPYIGELIGYRRLDTLANTSLPATVKRQLSERSQVANTLRYRRRKGTLAVLEDLARDVTGWEAVAVEFFERMALTQHLNHTRLACRVAEIRTLPARPAVDSPFDSSAHTAELRPIAAGMGRYNLPNVGLFLWRTRALSIERQPATAADPDNHPRYFRFSPLGGDLQLFAAPRPEVDVSHLADPENVPAPISRRGLHDDLTTTGRAPRLYGPGRSLLLWANGVPVPADQVVAANLSDDPGSDKWADETWSDPLKELLKDCYALDPVLGRIVAPQSSNGPEQLEVSYRFGAPAATGSVLAEAALPELPDGTNTRSVPEDVPLLRDAIRRLKQASAPAAEAFLQDNVPHALRSLDAARFAPLAIRGAPGKRPQIRLERGCRLTGDDGSEILLEGLLVGGAGLVVPQKRPGPGSRPNCLRSLHLRRCTLVPGLSLNPDGSAASPRMPVLVVHVPGVTIRAENCILGALRVHPDATVELKNCIIDAGDPTAVAYAGHDGKAAGGKIVAVNCTFVGRVHAMALEEVASTIFLSRFQDGDSWAGVGSGQRAPVRAERRQIGCVRHSFVPWGSRLPRQEACYPASEAESHWLWPCFISLHYGAAGYVQLAADNPRQIWQGADDGACPGVYHDLYEPQRLANLRARLDEYLRFGMQAGIFIIP